MADATITQQLAALNDRLRLGQPAGRRTRVLCDATITPTMGENPRYAADQPPPPGQPWPEVDHFGNARWVRNGDAYAFLTSMGVERAPMFYLSTFRQAPMWMGKTYEEVQGGRNFDYTLQDLNAANPPRLDVCAALGTLLKDPSVYRSDVKPHAPCIIDIEQANQDTDQPDRMTCSSEAPDEEKVLVLNRWIDAVLTIKRTAGGMQEVWCHDLLPAMAVMVFGGGGQSRPRRALSPALADAWHALMRTFDAATVMQYWWDIPAENEDWWLAGAANNLAAVADYAPHYNGPGGARVVVMCPFIQIYYPTHDLPGTAALHNLPGPIVPWRRAVDWYVDRGYWIYLWTGNLVIDAVKQHLQYAAACGYNYRPPA